MGRARWPWALRSARIHASILALSGLLTGCSGSPDAPAEVLPDAPSDVTSMAVSPVTRALAGQPLAVILTTARTHLLHGDGPSAVAAYTLARAEAEAASAGSEMRVEAIVGLGDAQTVMSEWEAALATYGASSPTVPVVPSSGANSDAESMTATQLRQRWLEIRAQPRRAARRAAAPQLRGMLKRANTLGDAWLAARLTSLMAENADPAVDSDALLALLDSALDTARSTGDRVGQVLLLRAGGRYQADRGEVEAGLEQLTAAAALVADMRAPGHQSRVHQDLGILASWRDDDAAALQHYQTAAAFAASVPKAYAYCMGNIGVLYAKQGNYPLARQAMDEALRVSASSKDRRGEAIAMLNLMRLHTTFGETALARDLAVRVAPVADKVLSPSQTLDHWLTVGQLELTQDELERAEAAFRRALEGTGLKPTSRAEAHLGLAEIALQRGQPQAALTLASEADSTTQVELINRSEVLRARALRALGRADEAGQRLRSAVQGVEDRIATKAGGAMPSEQLVDSSFALYGELVDLLVEQGDLDTALYWSEKAKARALLVSLAGGEPAKTPAEDTERPEPDSEAQAEEQALVARLARLNQAWLEQKAQGQSDSATALQIELDRARLALGQFQTALYTQDDALARARAAFPLWDRLTSTHDWPSVDTGVLAYVVLDEETLIFVLRRTSMASPPTLQVHRVDMGWDALASLGHTLRRRLTQRHAQFTWAAERLYDVLIAPVVDDLDGLSQLTIVADGPLWDVPFRLLGPADGAIVAERWTVSNAHSLSALASLRRLQQAHHARRAGRDESSILAVGDPTFSESASRLVAELRGFGPLGRLPDAIEEVREIASVYGDGSQVLVGEEATEARVKALAGDFQTIHLATHALLDDRNPLYSTLVLAPGGAEDGVPADDGLLEGWEVAALDLEADLVVLAGCQTLAGRLKTARGLMGLAWAFARAGVPTVVAAHWEVDSEATRLLMVRFHQLLHAGHGPADALNRAALALRSQPRFAHPFYWAGFSLVGVADSAK